MGFIRIYAFYLYRCYIFFSGLHICNKIRDGFFTNRGPRAASGPVQISGPLPAGGWPAGAVTSLARREEHALPSHTELPVQPVVLNEMNMLVSAQCFREGGGNGLIHYLS